MKKVSFSIDRAGSGTLTEKVVRELRRRIADGILRPGDRLPSRDALARELGVSEFVVRRAFVELAADRLIAGRPRIGHVVLDAGAVRRESLVLDVSTENFGSFASRVSTAEICCCASKTRIAPVSYRAQRSIYWRRWTG